MQGAYSASPSSGLTSAPALYGRPAIIKAERRAAGAPFCHRIDRCCRHYQSCFQFEPATPPAGRRKRIKLPFVRCARASVPGCAWRGLQHIELLDAERGSRYPRSMGDSIQPGYLVGGYHGTPAQSARAHCLRSGVGAQGSARGRCGERQCTRTEAVRLQQSRQGDLAEAGGSSRPRSGQGQRMARAKVDSVVADKVTPVKQQKPVSSREPANGFKRKSSSWTR